MGEKLKNIVLVGFMGTGKSSVAREISRIIEFPHIETDQIIEDQEEMKISQIFEEKGEPYFRTLEHNLLLKLSQNEHEKSVISTGGGMPMLLENRALLRSLGFVVWLKTSEKETCERVSFNKDRPLLNSGDLQKTVKDLLEVRRPVYREVSEFEVETGGLTVSEIASGVVNSARYYFLSH